MFDDELDTGLGTICTCGSGEDYGSCCGSKSKCECGSGMSAGECCYESVAEEHVYDHEEWN